VSSFGIGLIVLACVFGGALLGMFLRGALPGHHLSAESKDVVKLATGLIATMAALVLGLLIASAKGAYDTQDNEVKQASANVMLLDRTLARYGPETKEAREIVRGAVARRLALTWPEDASKATMEAPEMNPTFETLGNTLRNLAPTDDAHRFLKSRTLEIIGDLERTRWLIFGNLGESLPLPFLVVLIFWIAVIFLSFGLMAPPNGTVVTALLLAAFSISASLYLIVELAHPFEGLLKISSTPLRYTLAHLGQ